MRAYFSLLLVFAAVLQQYHTYFITQFTCLCCLLCPCSHTPIYSDDYSYLSNEMDVEMGEEAGDPVVGHFSFLSRKQVILEMVRPTVSFGKKRLRSKEEVLKVRSKQNNVRVRVSFASIAA